MSLFVFIFVRARANYWVRHRCGEWVIGHSGTVIVSEGGFVAAGRQRTCVEGVTTLYTKYL